MVFYTIYNGWADIGKTNNQFLRIHPGDYSSVRSNKLILNKMIKGSAVKAEKGKKLLRTLKSYFSSLEFKC